MPQHGQFVFSVNRQGEKYDQAKSMPKKAQPTCSMSVPDTRAYKNNCVQVLSGGVITKRVEYQATSLPKSHVGLSSAG